ncbi:SOSS complex subunit A homolog [Caenorhabditis elegans]|uniref:SOSS complex subunit A homolog n=3 Tax=Caenorhabditis elegans TaxID=6239 RepID=A0A1C3NSQ4_CAEEL|nr:SOSS complex subunit A homolog [Caenorhabditis elegans]SBV53376.1 SOSS complex subunit A homolog [Caenorhabditis elegans]|eukprot:NP_001317883.1 Uncharacterized protein CELE_Y56A3A.31 [Caenorhabditis elegans]
MAPKKKMFQKSMSALMLGGAESAAPLAGSGVLASNSAGSSPPGAAGTPSAASQTPTTSTPPSSTTTTLTEQAKGVLAQLVKTSKMSRSRGSALAEKPEVQAMLDKDLFLIQSDRRTKMNAMQQLQLVRVLAQFFLERVDDGHRYSYFEAIFLGRSDDPTLHEYRLSVMFQLVSFSIQYPVLQILNHVMGWLCQMKNVEQERIYSDRLIDMIIEHFVRLSNEQNRMHEYLIPLEGTCSEFCALFVSRATLHGPLSPPMITLIVRYCTRNMQFILRHLRDTSWLGNDFAEKVVPKLVEQTLLDDDSDSLGSCLCYVLFRWHIDVLANEDRKGPTKRIEVLDLLLSADYPWTKRRACVLASAIGASTRPEAEIQKELQRLEVPEHFQPVIDLLCSKGIKKSSQTVLDAISEMHLVEEMDRMITEDDI